MSRWERRAAVRRKRIASTRRARTGGLAIASLALTPFLAGGAPVPVAYRAPAPVQHSTVDDATSVDGRVPLALSLSPDVLGVAGDPLMLMQQLNLPSDIPITPMGAPITGVLGIPATVLAAYKNAEQVLAGSKPGCHVSWSLLAGIGRIESSHARGGRVDGGGTTATPILGPVLNGAGAFAAIADTDNGAFDGDPVWDRAVGPMQFIPGTWRRYAADGNGDGVSDPHNIYDAAVAAAKYLCAGGGDLNDPQQRAQAVFRYNHSDSYVRTVLLWADAYARGAVTVADGTGPLFASTVVPEIAAAAPPPPPPPPVEPVPGPVVPPPGPSTPDDSAATDPDEPEETTTSSPSEPPTSSTTTNPTTTTTGEPPVTTTEPPVESTTTTELPASA